MTATYWWEGDSTQHYWVEIRYISGTGSELRCPVTDANGHRNGWYDLVDAVEPGDKVYHWHVKDHRFVGWSYAASKRSIRDGERVVPLQGFTPLREVVDLESVRDHTRDIERICDAIDHAAAGLPTYLPFQRRHDGIRMMSNYFAKLPKELIPILFGTASADVADDSQGGMHGAESLAISRMTYLEPFKPKAYSEYLANMAGRLERRTRHHERLVNGFAAWHVDHGFAVQRNQAVDLAVAEPQVIIEAKVLDDVGLQNQIRQAVGQLYEYRYFQVVDPQAALLFLASRRLDPIWERYLEEDRHIGVAWSDGPSYKLSGLAQRCLASGDG